MTDETLTILLTALPPTLVAMGALIVSMRNHRQGKRIHVLVNSSFSRVLADLSIANQRIAELEDLIGKTTEHMPINRS
jgi:hypothetical protein